MCGYFVSLPFHGTGAAFQHPGWRSTGFLLSFGPPVKPAFVQSYCGPISFVTGFSPARPVPSK